MRPRVWRTARWILVLSLAPCAVAEAQNAAPVQSYASVVDQICRRYAEAQRAEAPDVMYAQCMYARGYIVPGFSPSGVSGSVARPGDDRRRQLAPEAPGVGSGEVNEE